MKIVMKTSIIFQQNIEIIEPFIINNSRKTSISFFVRGFKNNKNFKNKGGSFKKIKKFDTFFF